MRICPNLDELKKASRDFADKYVNQTPGLSEEERQKMYDEIISIFYESDEKEAELTKDYILGDWRTSDKVHTINMDAIRKVYDVRQRYIAKNKQ
ncbi:MAG: hypothetical protein LBT30_06205 [Clostridiales bacterium]|jgi:hypothetical protein|nr:hypothetical protein [Clostridiales bacterium]